MITTKEVKRIAKLARLGLTEKETAQYQKELSKILGYIEKLKEIDVLGVEPMSHTVLVENVMRKDIEDLLPKLKGPRLMDLAPETKEGYLKTKSIFSRRS